MTLQTARNEFQNRISDSNIRSEYKNYKLPISTGFILDIASISAAYKWYLFIFLCKVFFLKSGTASFELERHRLF